MRTCADNAGVSASIDDGILSVWPKNGARKSSDEVPEINVRSGMISYPSFTAQGLKVRTLFNPAIRFGAKVKVTSDLKPACGIWSVLTLDHSLDTQMPNGHWSSDIGLYNPSFPVVAR